MILINKTRDVKTPYRGTDGSAGIDFFVPKFDDSFIADFLKANPLAKLSNENDSMFPASVILEAEENKKAFIRVNPNTGVLIPAGIRYIIPEDTALIAMNKSGIATKKGLIVGACVGDEDYEGEFHISLYNIGSYPRWIYEGEKILQALILPVIKGSTDIISDSTFDSMAAERREGVEIIRGDGGFGSTAKKDE
jgi:dUTPase